MLHVTSNFSNGCYKTGVDHLDLWIDAQEGTLSSAYHHNHSSKHSSATNCQVKGQFDWLV